MPLNAAHAVVRWSSKVGASVTFQSPHSPRTRVGTVVTMTLGSGGSTRTVTRRCAGSGTKPKRTALKFTSSASGPTL